MIVIVCLGLLASCAFASLETDFRQPPSSAHPWVYWFWPNGYITKEGITADLEAMKRVGIGGVLLMEVDEFTPVVSAPTPPPGPVVFLSSEWRALFKHAVSEADRLGLQIVVNSGSGWGGSGGPWVTPDQSMLVTTSSEVVVNGPTHFNNVLPQPDSKLNFYKDIVVLAYPVPQVDQQIQNINIKGDFYFDFFTNLSPEAIVESASDSMVVKTNQIVDVTNYMTPDGRLNWDVPAGNWKIVRFGYTTTQRMAFPPGKTGEGLECDKLSREGVKAQFDNMVGALAQDNSAYVGRTLVGTHIDSWEMSTQNWTPKMREEFRLRRGYDMTPFLPTLHGQYVGSAEITQRFLWDLRKTVSDMITDNYSGGLRDLASRYGMGLSLEAYLCPCDEMTFGGSAIQPQCEFWTTDNQTLLYNVKEMASTCHVYGKPILGAEAFTGDFTEKFQSHPATMKPVGDLAFSLGVNKMIVHRYAHQPWPNVKPGMSMGFWGTHYDRNQTWWEQSAAWNDYLSRCQYMLRQGTFVADVCYLRPEWTPLSIRERHLKGYDYDECTPELVLKDMTVVNGKLALSSGMQYKVMVLSDYTTMTPELLSKIRELVRAGATVIGNKPLKSPSLTNYPQCDTDLKTIADDLWGNLDGKTVKQRQYGAGLILCGVDPVSYLASLNVGPDFASSRPLVYIHRALADGQDIYFVSNQQNTKVTTTATFRVTGKKPYFWWPDTGKTESAPVYGSTAGGTNVLLNLDQYGSVFVVFKPAVLNSTQVASIVDNGVTIPAQNNRITINRAIYGVLGTPSVRDVSDKIRQMIAGGETSFRVSWLAFGDDPAFLFAKSLDLEYTLNGATIDLVAGNSEIVDLVPPPPSVIPNADFRQINGRTSLVAFKPGQYSVHRQNGRNETITIPWVPTPIKVDGPWTVTFPPNLGAPPSIRLKQLMSLTQYSDYGVRFFSGTATYKATFRIPEYLLRNRLEYDLDLGDVRVIAEVSLNGHDLGTLWKPPYKVNISKFLRPGTNSIQVKVTNLWINRMIGDEFLPEDAEFNYAPGDIFTDGTARSWPDWLIWNRPRTSGRITYSNYKIWRQSDNLIDSGLIGPVKVVLSTPVILDR